MKEDIFNLLWIKRGKYLLFCSVDFVSVFCYAKTGNAKVYTLEKKPQIIDKQTVTTCAVTTCTI